MAQQKYLSYEGLAHFLEKLNEKFAPIQAIVFKSSVDDIASLPALNTQKAGFMYNIKTGGLTTDDFVEGAGHIVADGENIAAVELFTGEYTVQSLAADADPKALGLYEVDTITYDDVTSTLASDADPAALGLYEFDGTDYNLTADTTVVASKSYFKQVVTYKLTTDRLPVSGKSYYLAGTVMKWDLMGGVFDLEDRYLEFGDTFPQGPASRMTDGRTFLFMGDDQKVYTHVDTPSGRPSENGYFEAVFTPVADATAYFNPKQQDLYEETALGSGIYALSSDIVVDTGKTYYTGVFTPSVDTTVDVSKNYYTEADQYKKAVIYEYSTTAEDWIAQSSSSDMIAITNTEIDDLFI